MDHLLSKEKAKKVQRREKEFCQVFRDCPESRNRSLKIIIHKFEEKTQ